MKTDKCSTVDSAALSIIKSVRFSKPLWDKVLKVSTALSVTPCALVRIVVENYVYEVEKSVNSES